MVKGIGLEGHSKNQMVFEKGDEGRHFFIVLEGVYCVEVENLKEGKKERPIYYYPGDSFGEVSLIYDVPRGTRIVADENSCLLTIKKETFNECGDLRKNILHLNSFFAAHPFF
jgi:CRP-like cAMP-binding protein